MHRSMNFKPRYLLLVALFSMSLSAQGQEDALSGWWENESQPVFVEMKHVDAMTQGTVASNSEKPESVGKQLFRNLKYDTKTKAWTGKIFVLKLGEEKDVTVVLQNPDQFQMTVKVGFFKKQVIWNRVSAFPDSLE